MAITTLSLGAIPRPSTFSRSCVRSFSALAPLYAPRNTAKSSKEKLAKEKAKRKKKKHVNYRQYNLKEVEQFTLCDAIRYIRAYEVGRPPRGPKYECHIKLKTKKDGPVIKSQMRLPHSVKTDIKICVICPPDSSAAKQAREAGAMLVGEEEVFEVIKSGKIEFDRCLAKPASLPKINQAGLGRILGPRGLMPSSKLGTVVDDVGRAIKNMQGGSVYRERQGVVRMAVGQLGFTPTQLRDNLKYFIGQIKKDAENLNDQVTKEIEEIVLSSTNSPGFSLNGEFRSDTSPGLDEL